MAAQEVLLIFTGRLAPGQERGAVQARLAKLYAKPVGQLDALFGGGHHIVKRASSAARLERLKEAFEQAGAVMEIRTAGQAYGDSEASAATNTNTAPGAANDRTSRYSLAEFVRSSRQRDGGQGVFELEDARLLEVNLDGKIWMKMGAMVAYQGDVRYTRENLLQKGWGRLLKRTATGEGTELTKAEGNGTVYLADRGKKITILRLDDDALYVNGNDVLALEWQIDWDVRLMKRVSAMLAGGLFNMHLSGSGLIAITTHYDPLTLEVTPGRPVFTDPNATVAWSASLDPTFRTDVSFKTFLGRGSGESLQMQFEGHGFVVVQPYEEYYGSR